MTLIQAQHRGPYAMWPGTPNVPWTIVGSTTYYGAVNELRFDDGQSYIRSPNGNRTIGFLLPPFDIPDNRTGGYVIRYRMRCDEEGHFARMELYQTLTLIASQSLQELFTTWETISFTLTQTQINNITNYAALRLLLTSSAGVSNNYITWCELEMPSGGKLLNPWDKNVIYGMQNHAKLGYYRHFP